MLEILVHMYVKVLQLMRGILSNLSPHHSTFTHVGRLTIDSTESEGRQKKSGILKEIQPTKLHTERKIRTDLSHE